MKGLIFILTVLISVTGLAQNTTGTIDSVSPTSTNKSKVKIEKPSSPNEKKGVEKVTVTGSHIKRIDVEGPTPLVVLDRESFDNTGINTVEEVFQESPYFQSVLNGGSSNHEGHARFRGQHAGNTLYLLNGMRLPKEAGGFYTSISYIPTSAIESVELLKDGGSAIYGSDAMAGVVNFQTRKDIDGTNVTIKAKTNEDGVGIEQNHVASYGRSSTDASLLVVGQYRKLEGYFEKDIGSFNLNGDESRLKFYQVSPDTEDIGLLSTGHYEFASGLSLSGTGIYSRKQQLKSRGPLDRSTPELGPYNTDRLSDTFMLQAQLQKDIFTTWNIKWQNSYSLQNVKNRTLSGDANFSLLRQHKENSSLNPKSVEAKNSLSNSLAFPTRRNSGQLFNSKLIASGDLTDLGEGTLSMAMGTEFEFESFRFNNDSSVVNGQNLSFGADNFKGLRRVNSVFTEFSLTPWTEVELQVAGRYDSYNDFGETFNPKLALSYRPHRMILLRSSYGTGFKPPGVKDPFVPAFNRSDRFYDPNCPRNQDGCEQLREDVTVVNNPSATFETSAHYNFGLIFQPTKEWTITVDQWNFDGEGTISNFTADHLMQFAGQFGSTDRLNGIGASFERDADGNITDITVPNIFNRAERSLRGIDLSIDYNDQGLLFNRNVSFGFGSTVSHIYSQKERRFEFSQEERFENSGTQNTASIFASTGGHFTRLAARTLLNGSFDSVRNNWDHPVYTEFDLTYSLTTQNIGSFTLGIKNVLDDQAPVDPRGDRDGNITFGSTEGTFRSLGRSWFFSYSMGI